MTNSKWHHPAREAALKMAVANSKSIAEVLRNLGLKGIGGNYSTVKHHIARLDLDVSHHTGQAWNKGRYLEPNSAKHKNTIRRSLIKKYGHKCWICNNTEWMGKPIPLEMDHINGQNNDHRLENLRILCCNCHAQTPTYRNRARDYGSLTIKTKSKKDNTSTVLTGIWMQNHCPTCWVKISKDATYCSAHVTHKNKIDWPDNETLLSMLAESNYYALGKKLGVSDNGIRKRVKKINNGTI